MCHTDAIDYSKFEFSTEARVMQTGQLLELKYDRFNRDGCGQHDRDESRELKPARPSTITA